MAKATTAQQDRPGVVAGTPYVVNKPFSMGGTAYERDQPFKPSAHELPDHKVTQLLRQRFIRPNQPT